MKVLPPWKLAERQEWAEGHPRLAGFYFGLLMTPVYLTILGTERVYLAALLGLVSWPLFAVGLKQRWGHRRGRVWSRVSDASLSWFMWLGIVVVIFTPYFILIGAVGTADGLIRLIATTGLTLSIWMERRRRRRPA
jgi:hypothetical protein